MRFDEDSQLDTSQVQDTRGRGGFGGFPRSGGVAIGGGAGILGLLVILLLQLLGGGTGTAALPGIDQVQGSNTDLKQECRTGADANAKQDCRVVAVVNSVQDFWAAEFQRRGGQYQKAPTRLFTGTVQTACGAASSEVGPFYCPRDQTVYIDLGFYQELQTKFGAKGGPFAQAYVLAHEYGHHVQNLSGTMEQVANGRSGPQSGSVRLELQADCYAGLWANHATTEP
ncbi:MAG TPA: neutral zinc metallopeptidase, partial [Actinomycetes bacterium]|nr:neutral zinc metallopeptidase [Actinomycetes bacterium]